MLLYLYLNAGHPGGRLGHQGKVASLPRLISDNITVIISPPFHQTLREFAPEAELGIQPFFLAFGLRWPHLPFFFPEKVTDLYPEDEDPRNPWVGDIPSIAWSNWG